MLRRKCQAFDVTTNIRRSAIYVGSLKTQQSTVHLVYGLVRYTYP